MSRPVQVYLAEAEIERLEAWARQRGWTKSQVVRAALRALTRPEPEDPLLSASGMLDGLPADLSERVGQHLVETFVATPRAAYRTRRSRPAVRR